MRSLSTSTTTTSLVFNDPPAHTWAVDHGPLSPRAIAEMEGDLIALVERLLDASGRCGPRCGQASGPVRADRRFRVQSDRGDRQSADVPMTRASRCGDWSLAILPLEPVIGPKLYTDWQQRREGLPRLSRDLVERRRARPGNPERDVLDAPDPGRGQWRAADREGALDNASSCSTAGHETTTNLIGNGLVARRSTPPRNGG